jgi:hypothetical protein
VYLLIYIKPLDAFTSGAERLQSELVQTFPSQRDESSTAIKQRSGGICDFECRIERRNRGR